MGAPKEKSWLEQAEDYTSEDYDRQRSFIPEYDDLGKALHDVKVGVLKGVYHGVKGLISGVIDLAIYLGKLQQDDPETKKKTWDFLVGVAREVYISRAGTPAEVQDQNRRIIAWGEKAWNGIRKSVTEQWEAAGKTPGKQTELVTQWVSRAVFEVALFFIGAGEAKAALKGSEVVADAAKLAETGRILDGAEVGCKTILMSNREILAEQALKDAAAAKRAAEAADAAKAADDAAKAAKAAEVPLVKEPPAPRPVEPPAPRGPRPQPEGRMRQQKLYDEGHSMSTWSGDNKSVVKIINQGDDVVLDHIVRGPLQPKGSSPSMLADAIRASGNPKPAKILVPNIIQKAPTSDAMLESVARAAAEELGGTVTKVTKGVDSGGKHFVNIEIGY
jgi:hypothetical protein